LIHNGGKADQKLSAAKPAYSLGKPIEVRATDLYKAIHVLRKCASAIDVAFEQISSTNS
jgi:hypothetical protein